MAEKKPQLMFVYIKPSAFVKEDLKILSKYFDVYEVEWWKGSKIINILRILNLSRKCDVSFAWFAGIHSAFAVFFSRLFGKKSIVVAGGYDVANIPEINSGAFSKGKYWKEGLWIKFTLKHADKILVVTGALIDGIEKNAKVYRKDIVVLPTGYSSEFWKCNANKKEDVVLTVAYLPNLKRIKIKGIDVFIEVARHMPHLKFLVVGAEEEPMKYLKEKAPENVEIVGPKKPEGIREYYSKAKVYCQLSISEGLPNAICESMLCGCVPIGTDVGGISEIIGDLGYLVPYAAVDETVKSIYKAMNSFKEAQQKVRQRIKNKFPKKRREEKLKKIINALIEN